MRAYKQVGEGYSRTAEPNDMTHTHTDTHALSHCGLPGEGDGMRETERLRERRSEEHTSELQPRDSNTYAVFR